MCRCLRQRRAQHTQLVAQLLKLVGSPPLVPTASAPQTEPRARWRRNRPRTPFLTSQQWILSTKRPKLDQMTSLLSAAWVGVQIHMHLLRSCPWTASDRDAIRALAVRWRRCPTSSFCLRDKVGEERERKREREKERERREYIWIIIFILSLSLYSFPSLLFSDYHHYHSLPSFSLSLIQ